MKTLRTAPFRINPGPIAEGLLEMFDDDERVALRFGMLPAEKMRVVEKALRERFLQNTTHNVDADKFLAILETPEKRECIEFSMKELVSEALHEIALALYEIGDLVV